MVELSPHHCLRCEASLDNAIAAYGPAAKPAPGDATVCLHCGHLMAFADDLSLRELTSTEREVLNRDPRVKLMERERREVMRRRRH